MKECQKQIKSLLNWNIFSVYRNELFGIAIIFILLFHSGIYFNYGRLKNFFDQLAFGVEIFLFLSGMGLYFSYSKKPRYFSFEKKRFLTVGVVYLITALPFCLWQNIVEHRSFLYFLFDLSSFSYWFKTENSPSWYISLILFLYLLYPPLNKLMFGKKGGNVRPIAVTVILSLIFIAVAYYLSRNEKAVWDCIERAFTRVPCFLVGCCCGKFIYEKKKFGIFSFLFLFSCLLSRYALEWITFRFRYFLTIIPIMLVISTALLFLIRIMNLKSVSSILCFLGSMTLELYLTHNFMSEILQYYQMTKGIYYVAAVAVSIPISYALSRLRNRVTAPVSKSKPIATTPNKS